MNNNFVHIIDAAADRKDSFNTSIESVKVMLDKSVRGSFDATKSINKVEFNHDLRTGWLRGSLSYPWVVVCFIIPAVLDSLV